VYRGLFFQDLLKLLVHRAFQNCHRAAVFRPGAAQALAEFTAARAQILNQSPELTNR
jgi:hypothetical protein